MEVGTRDQRERSGITRRVKSEGKWVMKEGATRRRRTVESLREDKKLEKVKK